MSSICNQEEYSILRHTIFGSRDEPYRNFYSVNPLKPYPHDMTVLEGLVKKGLMRRGKLVDDTTRPSRYYHLTAKGKKLALSAYPDNHG